MDAEVASSDAVPRFVDLALFLCGTALRGLRGELQPADAVTVRFYCWFLQKVCFLHALPNDDAEQTALDSVADDDHHDIAKLRSTPENDTSPLSSASIRCGFSKEVNFKVASYELRQAAKQSAGAPTAEEKADAAPSEAAANTFASVAGRVHARSPSDPSAMHSSYARYAESTIKLVRPPTDVGFSVLAEFLSIAHEQGGASLVQRMAAALADALSEQTALPGTVSPAERRAAIAAAASSSSSFSDVPAVVRVATLSKLFDEDLLDDELSTEAGNATRSFHIWVNYEWASASFLRQTRLAEVSTRWLQELCYYRDGRRPAAACLRSSSQRPLPLSKSTLSPLPANVKEMYTALEGVFEGHTNTRKLLMEMALLQRTSHLTDNALAKLLFLQGPPIAANMSRGELTNRGTQPILMSITGGMLLYAQYYLPFRSLAVARQCVRVALQMAQEVHSNSILALAHYTAHVIAVHQGRPADAANSISIALQLSLGSGALDNTGVGGSEGGNAASPFSADSADAQMASVAFAGAAQLLLFFPGAVSAALRSVLSTGRLGSGTVFGGEGDAAAGGSASTVPISQNNNNSGGGGGGAVSAQTVAQSIRHAVLRAETSLLHAPPAEGRWVGVVAGLHRETLLLIGAVYGIVSTPTSIDDASLKSLLEAVEREAALTSPLFQAQSRRSLFWEVLRHAAYHALNLQERFLPFDVDTPPSSSATAALRCLAAALCALRSHYGDAAVQVASDNIFFTCVVRYCAACRLQDSGHATAAYAVFTDVGQRLCSAAGVEAEQTSATSTGATISDFDDTSTQRSSQQQCWSPDHLLLYALAQHKRAKMAVFLGLVAVPPAAQQSLLSVSAHYNFSVGVLTAQLMEAETCLHNGRYTAALATAHRVEQSATRIGLFSLAEAACALQVTAHASRSDWCAARCVLQRLQPRNGSHRVFLLLYKFVVHLELLLLEKSVSSHDVRALARNWLQLLQREKLLRPSGTAVASGAELSLSEQVCLCNTVSRAFSLLGRNTSSLEAETAARLRRLQGRQGAPVPDVYVQGDCDEVCQHGLSSEL